MPAPKVPYPPSPADVPDDLTDFPPSYRSQQNLLLIGLFVFLLFYFGLIALCALLGTYCAVTLGSWPVAKVVGIGFFGLAFLFLVKGFFKRHPEEKEMRLEITEEEQPVLFGFIHQLCDELDAPEPDRVFVSPDVNAAMTARTSLVNLFTEPRKNLLIGLGLVNSVNLSEFKAVLAHEFGHFCQSAYAASYTIVTRQIIYDLVAGEDFLDRFVAWCKRQEGLGAVVGYTLGGLLWLGRKPLELAFRVITVQWLAVSREQEFHADSVAVSAAGSDAATHTLLRVRFGFLCLDKALDDLAVASEHKLYTRDLYYHQDRAAPVVRKEKKDPKLGLPPQLDDPRAGANIRVFDAEQEELEDDDVPIMYRTHPPDYEREENAKDRFVPAVIDHRSPWILFTDAADLKERMTYKFYRMAFRVKKDVELADPAEVQKFIDDERAETTYDPKYQGVYDIRPLEPGDIAELNQMIRQSPWDDDRIEKVYEKLYEGAGGKADDYQELKKEKATLENTPGRPSPRLKKKIKKIEAELDKLWEWFKSLDRRVYLCHVQMAAAVNPDWRDELVERYRFGLEIQKFYTEADHHAGKALFFGRVLFEMENPHPEFFAEVMQVFRQAWRALKKIVQEARDLNMPAMKNFEEGERLADFILEGKLVPEPPLSYVKANWINKLLDQLRGVSRRCFRLHWKSVGGILALQEKIAAAWLERRAPVEAAVVAEPVDAIPAEVVAAEVVTAMPLDTLPAVTVQPVEAVVVEAEIVPAEVVEAVPVDVPAPPASVAGLCEAGPGSATPVRNEPASQRPATEIQPAPASAPPADIFSLDAAKDERPAPAEVPARDAGRPGPGVGPEEVFSLDADEVKAAPAPATPPAPPADADAFVLDLSSPAEPAPEPAQSPSVGTGGLDPLVPLPTPVVGSTVTKPAKNGRPPLKITYVRPGERSPLAG